MSDFCTFEYVNKPDAGFVIESVREPYITYTVDYERQGNPKPTAFDRIGTVEVKLVVTATGFEGEVAEKADAAHDAIVDLKRAMADARGIEGDDRQDLMLGGIDVLPEVIGKEISHR